MLITNVQDKNTATASTAIIMGSLAMIMWRSAIKISNRAAFGARRTLGRTEDFTKDIMTGAVQPCVGEIQTKVKTKTGC